jgi:crossover junction endodeoxyribonuclease RuvC
LISPCRVLGIDPGTGRIGFGILEKNLEKNEAIRMLECGIIAPPKGERWERLPFIYSEMVRLMKEHKPHLLAIEKLFFNKNIKTAMAVGEAIGVILLAASHCRIPIREYTPMQVKETLVGSGKAKKHEVKGVLELLLNRKIKGPDDAADAVAVAYCHFSLEALGL